MNSIYEQHVKLDFNDVLIKPRINNIKSRAEVNLISKNVSRLLGVQATGVIAANMDGVGTIEVAKVLRQHNCLTALHKHYSLEQLIQFFQSEESSHAFYSMGVNPNDLEKFTKFAESYKTKAYPLKVCVDVANGYMNHVSDVVVAIKHLIPYSIVMAGNVVDFDGLSNLYPADIVKIGIGQGSNCLTRTQTGIGYPQFSAIYDISHCDGVASEDSPMLCSDGGCVTPGDVAKAIAAGADMVMLGGMLAGTEQGGNGQIIEDVQGNKFVQFYGMSSATAQKKHNGGLQDYRASEGRTTIVPYKGDMNKVIMDILGGLRSTCAYVGADDIDMLSSRARFIRVNSVINKSMEKYTIGT